MYHLGMSHISSNFFRSDLSKALRKGFHSACSMTLFNLRAIASDIEHEFFEMSLRWNSVEELVKTEGSQLYKRKVNFEITE